MSSRPPARGRLAVLASEAVLGASLALPRATTGVLLAGAGGALLWRPEVVVLAFFLAIDEVPDTSTFYTDAPRVLTAGTDLFRAQVGGVPLPLLLVVAGALLLSMRATHVSRGAWNRPAVAILVALSVWCGLLSILQDEDGAILGVAARAVTSAGPWLAVLAAYAFGTALVRHHRHTLALTVGCLLVAKAVLGTVVELVTGGVTVDSQRFVIFFDAALPTLAAAILVGRLLTDRRRWPAERLVVLAAGVVVLLSFRRAVWMFVAIAVVLVPLVRRRAVVARRVGVAMVCAVVVLLLAPGGLRKPVVDRVVEAVHVVQGQTNERNSSQLHLDDIGAGWRLAGDDPWGGIGVRALQPPGLAVAPGADRFLYVHNDPLQVWLRFGFPALVLFGGLLTHLAWRCLRLLGTARRIDLLDASAAVFAGGVAIPGMTAAFVTTTWRFPVLLGLAAAVLDHAFEQRAAAGDTPGHPAPVPALAAARA